MDQELLDKKITELEERLDKVDAFWDAITAEFMKLESGAFKCAVCERLNLGNYCSLFEVCPEKEKQNEIK